MANDPKTGKKKATKPAKVGGAHKVPKYEQNAPDAAANPIKTGSKSGK